MSTRTKFAQTVAIAIAVALAAARAAAADATPPQDAKPKVDVHAFVDFYYAYNANDPVDHENFLPGTGTTAKRADEFAVNLAQVEVSMPPEPVGFHVAVGAGTGEDVLHAAEIDGAGTGSEVWRHLLLASVTYRTKIGRGLAFEGGIYASPIGFESFASKDDWNYTRSWMAEYSPYYETGINVSYPFTDHWSGRIDVVNGWQIIGENNGAKSFGAQVAYDADALSAAFHVLAGPEIPGNDADWRVLGDFVVTVRPAPSWSVGFALDVVNQNEPTGPSSSWWGVAGYARYAFAGGKYALAARLERFEDPDGAISGTPQSLSEATLTFECRPVDHLILKLEGRYDRSTADVFTLDARDVAGAPLLGPSETLLVAGVVVTY